jgi:hypothetical protein
MRAMGRALLTWVLALALLDTVVSCGSPTSAVPAQLLWTARANWDGNGMAALYDSYTNSVITLTSADASQAGSPATVTALDPGTGHQHWSMVTDQTPQLAMAAKGLVFVATSGPAASVVSPAGGPPSVLVLDDRSGSEVRDINMASGATALGLTRGTIVAIDGTTLYGYASVTGRNSWHWRPTGGCTISQAAASAVVASVLATCANGDVILTSVNPASGTVLWSRKVGYYDSQPLPTGGGDSSNSYGISVQGGYMAVTSIGGVSIFSAAGLPLDSEQTMPYDQPFLAALGDHLFIVYASADGSLTVKDVDTRTRTSRVLLSRSFTPAAVTLADGTLYILAAPPWPLLPTAVIAVDIASASYTVSSLPLSSDVLFTSQYAGNSSIFAARRELLIAAGGPVLTAYSLPLSASTTLTPGIQAAGLRAWPEACSLLSTGTLRRIIGDTYVSAPQEISRGPAMPDALSCEYAPRDRAFPIITVGVAWSAKTTAQARELMLNAATESGMSQARGIGDQAYVCRVLPQCSAPDQLTAALVRVGPVIIDVEFSAFSRAWRSVATQIVSTLRRERSANG